MRNSYNGFESSHDIEQFSKDCEMYAEAMTSIQNNGNKGLIKKYIGLALYVAGFVSICLVAIFAALNSHDNNKEDYVLSDGVIYSWKAYKCIDGVMYRKGRSYTLLVNADGSPKLCNVKVMTNGEFYKLADK